MSADGADILLTDLGSDYLAEFITPKGEKLIKYFGETKADAAAETKKNEIISQSQSGY